MIDRAARHPREVAASALAGAAAWLGVVWLTNRSAMRMGPTMGFPMLGFLGAWTLMMAAMMLPAVSPVAALRGRRR